MADRSRRKLMTNGWLASLKIGGSTGNSLGIGRREEPDSVCSRRVTDEHVWRLLTGGPEQGTQLPGYLVKAARLGARVAPPQAGVVETAHAGGLGHLFLHACPDHAGVAQPSFEDNRGLSIACAVEMETVAPELDELPWRRETFRVATLHRRLERGAGEQKT